jgi:hypothetical protein
MQPDFPVNTDFHDWLDKRRHRFLERAGPNFDIAWFVDYFRPYSLAVDPAERQGA